jgi:hypothetical protein
LPAGKRKSKREFPAGALIIATALALMALSLVVRWSAIGRNLSLPDDPFQIEVLNGTGESGIAGDVTMKLRRMGIDVLIKGNAGRFDFRETVLVDRKGNPGLMRKLSRRLGVRRVVTQIQEKPLVDATLVIGWDRERLRLQH